jgi:sodium/proline symporter
LGGAWNVYELLPAFLVASIAIVVVSLATEKPTAEIEQIFDEVNAR